MSDLFPPAVPFEPDSDEEWAAAFLPAVDTELTTQHQVSWRDLFASRRYRGIEAFVGVPGGGKTYELARWSLAMQAEGREVWCSQGFSIPGCKVFSSVEEFCDIPNGAAIAMDEAPIWLDARAWKAMDTSVLVRLTHIRKYDIHFRYTAIAPGMVELRLRQITFEFTRCNGFLHRGPVNSLVRLKSPDGAPQLRANNSWPKFRLMRPEVCQAYDTRSEADTSAWVDLRPRKAA